MITLTMTIAGLVTYIGILTLAIVDLGLVLFRGTGGSVSQFLITTAFRSPFVSFAFGCTCGHLFFNMWPEGCVMNLTERYLIAGSGGLFAIFTLALVQAFFRRNKK